jgi:predicted Zn finger-like uncharacterized protein
VSLVTRCPVCATAFRVQRSQLAARAGKVRCGKCGTVFDGVSGLVEEGLEALQLEPSPQLGLFDPSRRAEHEEEALPEFLLREEVQPRSRLLWGLLLVLATAALAAQAGYRFRTEIAAFAPSARDGVESACKVLRCRIAVPRRPDLMSIESSDLQADPRADNLIVLNAVLRNRAPFTQDYPALELTLTDEAERPVVRRVLMPADYLAASRPPSAEGLGSGAEASFRVTFDAGRTRATGYRLYLFFPQ